MVTTPTNSSPADSAEAQVPEIRRTVRRTTHTLGDAQDLVVDHYEVEGATATVLSLPGFGRTADEYFHLTAGLLDNGVSVVVPDFRAHPGRSSGAIMNFTLHGQAEDVSTMLDRFDVDAVLATSLSFPPSLRTLADRGWTGHLVGIVPVVCCGDTLKVVTGYDWHDLEDGDYPRDLVLDIDGFNVNIELVAAACRNSMLEVEPTMADAKRFGGKLSLVVGESDSWIDSDQIRMVADSAADAEIVELKDIGHDFGRSVRRARVMFHESVTAFLRARGAAVRPELPIDVVIQARQELRETGATTRLGATA
jgi:hypothetical protein